MIFNSDPAKQAQEAMFSRKTRSPKHHTLYFNSLVVEKVETQKHLGLKLHKRLNFREHLKGNFAIGNAGIEMSKKLSNFLPCHS